MKCKQLASVLKTSNKFSFHTIFAGVTATGTLVIFYALVEVKVVWILN